MHAVLNAISAQFVYMYKLLFSYKIHKLCTTTHPYLQ